MAHVQKQDILLGGTRVVGAVSVDGGAIRGEGGPVRPQLVVPLTIRMNPMGAGGMIALCSIAARLSTDEHASPRQAVCQPLHENLTRGFPFHSLPSGTNEYTVSLRFFLRPEEVDDLERRRHSNDGEIFTLYLGLDPVIAGLVNSLDDHGRPSAENAGIWDPGFGMYSQTLPFWASEIRPLVIQIESSTWVRDVLPGLGHDHRRFVELRFPPRLPDHPNAATQFDKASRALDEARYEDCVQECRGLLNMWEKLVGATSARRVADFVATARSWPESDARQTLLDTVWKHVGDIANRPHHPEGDFAGGAFDRHDARFVLVLTAALCEYVGAR